MKSYSKTVTLKYHALHRHGTSEICGWERLLITKRPHRRAKFQCGTVTNEYSRPRRTSPSVSPASSTSAWPFSSWTTREANWTVAMAEKLIPATDIIHPLTAGSQPVAPPRPARFTPRSRSLPRSWSSACRSLVCMQLQSNH
jgi:hypothetical protein